MAFVGMRYVVAAPVDTETPGTGITYGNGFVVGKAIQANLTITRNNNPLYADDTIAEEDNGIVSMSVQLGVDDIDDEVREKLLGEIKTNTAASGATASYVYDETDQSAPYVGFGYMRVRRKGGTTYYQALWCHKAIFGIDSENAQTKAESITWDTPVLTGRISGVSFGGHINFRRKKEFATETEARTWLNSQAGITQQGT